MHNNIYQNKKQQKSHYVYLIYNKREKKHYIGVRSCKGNPIDDIGIRYFSSSYDEQFMTEQKEYPDNFYYKILKTFKTRNKANEYEEILLKKVNAHINSKFYNISINGKAFCSFNSKPSEIQIENLRLLNYKYDYKIYYENGSIYETNNLSQFAKENGYNIGSLHKVKKKTMQKYKDIIKIEAFKVTDEYKESIKKSKTKEKDIKLYKIYREGGRISEADDLSRFAKENDYSVSSLYMIKNNKRRKHKDIIKIETFINDILVESLNKLTYKPEVYYLIHHKCGKINKIDNLETFAKENNYHSGSLSHVKNKTRRFHKDIIKIERFEDGELVEIEDKKPHNPLLSYKIYHKNGGVFETDNLTHFATENNYSICHLTDILNKNIRKREDIIKIERFEDGELVEIEDKKPYKPSVLYKIYTVNGRITETDNLTKFANENGYCKSCVYFIKNKKIRHHKDIIKIETFEDGKLVEIDNETPYKPLISYKIYYKDDKIDKTFNLTEFARDNNYNPNCLIEVKNKRRRYHKDIIGVEHYEDGKLIEIESDVPYKPLISYKIFHKCGRISETNKLAKFAKDNNYSSGCLYHLKNKRLNEHKDIIKIETFEDGKLVEIDNETLYRPLVSYKIYFEDGRISETENLKKFSEENGYVYGSLHSVKSKKQKTYKDIINIDTVELMLFT